MQTWFIDTGTAKNKLQSSVSINQMDSSSTERVQKCYFGMWAQIYWNLKTYVLNYQGSNKLYQGIGVSLVTILEQSE